MIAKKIAIGFGVAVLLPLIIHYGVSSFVPIPKDIKDNYNNGLSRHQMNEKNRRNSNADRSAIQTKESIAIKNRELKNTRNIKRINEKNDRKY